MKKITLLCLASDKGASLEKLKRLGVLHVADVRPPESRELDAAEATLAQAERALAALAAEKKPGQPADEGMSPEAIVERTNFLVERKRELSAELDRLRGHLNRIEPIGELDLDSIAELSEAGLGLRLFLVPAKARPKAPAGSSLLVLSQDKATKIIAVIGHDVSEAEVPSDWEELGLPEPGLARTKRLISDSAYELEQVESSLKSLAARSATVAELIPRLRREAEFLSVSAGMGAAGSIEYVMGYCPEPELGKLRSAAAARGWGLLIEEPGPDDPVPTLIKYPAWVRPVKAVFETINVLPGYREIDVSAVFLIFFSLFFGMIIGDAGYGLLFLIATLFAKRKMKTAPSYVFTMLIILSLCAIGWGALTGNYFGMASAPGPLKALSINWLDKNTNVMKLCFLIGSVHLTIAHLWNTVRFINSLQALAQVGWILMTWTMYFAAGFFVCGEPFPMPWAAGMGVIGLILIIAFMTPLNKLKSEFIQHAMLPLSVINNFVDVVSYVRLFAVGMASVQVAQSFNSMAAGLGAGHLWAAPVAALILVGGHAMNILLSALGVLVHGVRLNTLEFSNHIGLEWAGMEYSPFQAGE